MGLAEKVGMDGLSGCEIEKLLAKQRQHWRFLNDNGLPAVAWDLLVRAAWSVARDRYPSVTDLCLMVNHPQTTALRHIGILETRGLIVREQDTADGRRWFVDLTPKGKKVVRKYLRDERIS